ncbi:MAG: response regulator, partial [Synergistaceae bacterium]|nr:response regulator [Synergistaceae bacterium]
ELRAFFGEVMKSVSMECGTAADGESALAAVRKALSQGSPYDVIFLDWQLDGLEMTRRLQEMRNGPVIVAMTPMAKCSMESDETMKAGVSKFLPKPILPAILLETLREIAGGSESGGAEPPRDWSGKHILLAEDIEINREIVHSVLGEMGVRVEDAEDGQAAVEMFEAAPERYDAVLMDIQMPRMDGYTATGLIRGSGHSRGASVPIIAMTANAFKEDVDRCLTAGMNDYIAKPVSFSEMIDKLAAYL